MIANEQKSRWHRIPLYDKSKIACHGDQRIQWYSNNLGIDDNWVIDEVEHLYTPLRVKNHISPQNNSEIHSSSEIACRDHHKRIQETGFRNGQIHGNHDLSESKMQEAWHQGPETRKMIHFTSNSSEIRYRTPYRVSHHR